MTQTPSHATCIVPRFTFTHFGEPLEQPTPDPPLQGQYNVLGFLMWPDLVYCISTIYIKLLFSIVGGRLVKHAQKCLICSQEALILILYASASLCPAV